MDDFKIIDITGDNKDIIVRVSTSEMEEIQGIWFQNHNGIWNCLHEEIDKKLANMVLNHEMVKEKIVL